MKKLFLLAASVFIGSAVQAQPWLKGVDMSQPVKLQDIADAYIRQRSGGSDAHEKDAEGNLKEGKDYHFSRWMWYWERHLDENGYMVSPLQKWHEIKAFEKQRTANKTTAVDQSGWQFGGPDRFTGGANNGVGRINVVSFHPTDSNTFWIGSAGGGAWKTNDGGINWTVINDFLPVLGVSDIDFNPLNPNTIYMCTGDRNAKDNYSVGVLKSYDGGLSWDTTGLKISTTEMRQTAGLVINPADTNSLTLAASNGLYKSYDGGASWTFTIGGDFRQVLYHPADTNIIYAAGLNNVFHSTDGGLTWAPATTFSSGVARIEMAVSPLAPNVLKAIAVNASNGLEGIYRSSDTAQNFVKIFSDGVNCSTNILASSPNGSSCGGQGWYDLSFTISPLDTNVVIAGGVNTWMSSDGGYTWKISNQWNNSQPGVQLIHADKHYHAYNPIAPTALYECNDGGIFKTYAPGSNLWTNLTNGLGITQFYRNAVANNATFVIGGAQDNGTKRLAGTTYSQLTGADGMDCHIDYSDSKIFYTSQQYGELRRTNNNGANFTDISNTIPGGQPTGAWITPMAIHPYIANQIYAGYTQLYMSTNRGGSWKSISPSFGSNINRIAISWLNPDKIYVLVNNTIRYIEEEGGTWKTQSKTFSGNVSDIIVHPTTNNLWVTMNGVGTNKVAEFDSAQNRWIHRNEQLPNVPVNCITIDTSNGTVYIGTDIGVFYRDYNVIEWVPFRNNLPTVEVTDLGINYATGEIWAATYGRGMWRSKKHDPTQTTAIHNVPLANNIITIAPNPSNGRFAINTSHKALLGKTVTVRIVSMTGATAWLNNVAINAAGSAAVTADLPKGSYIVEISSNNMPYAREKVIIH